jgi:hypothetical protein
MRHAEWKKLLVNPIVLKAQEALRMAKEELALDPLWKQSASRFHIFPDASRKKGLFLLESDFAPGSSGQAPMTRSEIAWDSIANADPEEAKAIVLAAIMKFTPALGH